MLYHHYLGAYPGVVAIVAMMAQDFILHIRLFFCGCHTWDPTIMIYHILHIIKPAYEVGIPFFLDMEYIYIWNIIFPGEKLNNTLDSIGYDIYNVVPPIYKLVYNPHEYYRYIYHKSYLL